MVAGVQRQVLRDSEMERQRVNTNTSENQVEGPTFSDLVLQVTKPHCPYTPLVRVVTRPTQIQGEGMRPTSPWEQSQSHRQDVLWDGRNAREWPSLGKCCLPCCIGEEGGGDACSES